MKKSNRLRNLWYGLSSNQRFAIRRFYYLPQDLWDSILGKNHKYVPPRGYIYTGSPDSAVNYLKQGQHQLQLLKSEINLQPEDKVLDIGSGIGRTAIALTDYLNKNGSYDGFDVVESGVKWCNSKIGKDYSNFHFKYVPLFNDLYNTATMQATDFQFPYSEKYFDKIFSFSVFTHMQIEEIQHYFGQINSVLNTNGMALSTFFLYDDDSEDYISTKVNFSFSVKKDGFLLMSENVKSGNIAIHKAKLTQMLAAKNLEVVKIIDGFWKDEVQDSSKLEYQDIVVFRKANLRA